MTAEPLLPPPTWRDLLDAQGQVLTRAQALAGGLSEDAWRWRVRDGGPWQTLLPGVAVAHRGTPTFDEQVQAAVLYGGPGAAVSGDALLHLTTRRWPEPQQVDVAVDARCQRSRYGLFVPHRVTRLDALRHPAREPRRLRTPPAVLQAAAWSVSDRAAEWRVAAAVQQRLVTVAGLRDALQLLPRLRRRAAIRIVLDDVELGAHARTELDFLQFLRRHGLPLPDQLQFLVRANGKRYLDGWWERQRVAAEVDGAHHMDVAAWDEDALRANAVVVAHRADRVVLLRVTSGNMRHAPEQLAAQFRAVLL